MRLRSVARLGVSAALALIMGCTTLRPTPTAPICEPGHERVIRDVLYFGRNRPGGVVSEDEWVRFVDDIITPRFPAGFTATSARGRWQNAAGTIEQESSQIVTLLHVDNAADHRALDEIIASYKQRFEQESVLWERQPSCVRY